MAGSNELCGLDVITEICKKEHIRGNASILKQLLAEFCESPLTNLIENADVVSLGGGEFQIDIIEDPRDGYIAITEDLTFYEFDGTAWTLKFAGLGGFIASASDNGDDTYTFTSFDGSTNFTIAIPILSVEAGTGIDVDVTDPKRPAVRLNQASQDSLDLADSAVQPGDNADLAIPEYATDEDADNDTGLEEKYPYSVAGERTVKTKINSGSIQELYKFNRFNDRYTALYGLNHSKIYEKESLNPLPIIRADYNALNEYEDRYYIVDKEGVYYAGTAISKEVWSYEPVDMHVSKSGNDTTGDGSFANPYLTINKAITEAPLTGGFTIWVGEGEYIEGSGSGYMTLSNRMFTSNVSVKSKPNEEVVITSTGNYTIRFSSVQNMSFEGITFPTTAASTYLFFVAGPDTLHNLKMIECKFIDDYSTSYLLYSVPSDAQTQVTNISFNRCLFDYGIVHVLGCSNISIVGSIFNESGINIRDTVYGDVVVSNNTVTNSSSNPGINFNANTNGIIVSIIKNTIKSTHKGIVVPGGGSGNEVVLNIAENVVKSGGTGIQTNGQIRNSTVEKNIVRASGPVGIGFPIDSGGIIVDSVVRYNHIISDTGPGHALLISEFSDNIEIYGNISESINSASYSLVLKGDNHLVHDNLFIGGTLYAAYLKGARYCIVKNNVLIQNQGGWALSFDSDTNASKDNQVINNVIKVSDGSVFRCNTLDVGNIVNHNQYLLEGPVTWGEIIGTTVSSLDEVKQAWLNSYGTPNDNKSIQLKELP